MGQYKKGDWVRLVREGLSTMGAIGKLAKIEAIDEESHWPFLLDIVPPVDYETAAVSKNYTRAVAADLEPWQPKVGERVRVPVSANEVWAGEGEVTRISDICVIVKMLTGDNKGNLGGFFHGTLEPIINAPVAATQPAPDGGNTAAQVDTIADEYGPVVREVPVAQQQARFKVGDVVVGVINPIEYVVLNVRANGNLDVRTKNDWQTYYNEPVRVFKPATPPTPAIVCKLDNGQPLPAHRPHVHATVEAADKEAARLAGLHKGQEFAVFALTGTPYRVANAYDHEWQRLADEGKRADAEAELRRITGMSHSLARHVVSNRAAQPTNAAGRQPAVTTPPQGAPMTFPFDHVPIEPPTPKRMSRLATAALFVLTFLVGMFAGLAL